MSQVRSVASSLLMSVVAVFSGSAPAKLSLDDKEMLQSAMRQHVETSMVGGAFLHLDAVSGDVRPLQSDEAQPMIIRMGRYFVLCAGFRDGDGKRVNVDFYLAPCDKSFVVFQSLIEDRAVLRRLMRKGDAVRVG